MCPKKSGIINLHSFLLFWRSSGRQDIQGSRPLDHSCLTAILVLAQGQRWVIAIISLHPLSKVSERKSVRKRGAKECIKTFPANILLDQLLYFMSRNARTDASYVEREKTHVCLLCWPVAPGLSPTQPPQITSRRVMKGSRALKQQLKWTLSVPFPWEQLSHGRLAYIQNMQSKAFLTSKNPSVVATKLMLQQPFGPIKHPKSSFSEDLFKPWKNAKNYKFRHANTEGMCSFMHLKIHSSRCLTCTPMPLFLTLSPPLPCFYLCILPAFRPPSRRERGQER